MKSETLTMSLLDPTNDDQSVSLDLERELVNHLVDKASVEFIIREGLSTDLFYTPTNKAIFNFVNEYFNETSGAPSPAVLTTEFPNVQLSETQSSVHWIVDKLRERYQRNKVQELAWNLAEISHDPKQAMDMLTGEVLEIQRNSVSQRHVWGAGDSSLFLSSLQDKILEGNYKGVTLGFDKVDQFTGGLRSGHLGFLAARPKRQKTFFMLKAFIEQKRQGNSPIFFTLENTEEEIMLRISCMLSGYPWDMAQRGEITSQGWKMLENAWKEFDSLGQHWISNPSFDERTVPSMILQADKLGADSIIISQFKWIQPTNSYYLHRPDHEKWASIVSDLKLGAIRQGHERPIYVEAQLNREGESLEEFSEIGLGQLGLTDTMGQVGDIVYALYQNKDMRENKQIQFGIVESRNTDKHNWYVTSEFKSQTYMEMT